MIAYEVENMTNSAITVEDCGVLLPGLGSKAKIPEEAFLKSKSITGIQSMIRWKKIVVPDIWPFAKMTSSSSPTPVPSPPERPSPQTLVNDDKISMLLDRMDHLIQVMERSGGVVPSTSKEPSLLIPSTIDEPLFIASNLVPKDAESRLEVQTSSSDSDGLDEAANVLRAIRKGRK